MAEEIRTGTINALWLNNIYENIKNLENMERLARQGCQDIFEHFQALREERTSLYAELQYKNLKLMITEMDLLLTDLTPILEQDPTKKDIADEFRKHIKKVGKISENRKLFVKESRGIDGSIKLSKNTDFFIETLNFISDLKREIFKNIKHILYIQSTQTWEH